MSTIDTSTWNPDADLNTAIEGIPLNSNASIAQTWQALRVLMAAVKGDGDAIKAMIDVMQGATASADGASGLVPKPLAGDQDKVLKGDGTWGTVAAASHTHGNITSDGKLSTASRAVVTDGNKAIGVSSVTATELGYLSGVTSAVQTQLDAKAPAAATELADSVDVNTVTTPGCYTVRGYTAQHGADTNGASLIVWTSRNSRINQLWLSTATGAPVFRRFFNGSSWSAWRRLVEADAPPSASPASYVLCGDGAWRKPADIS